ncbi:MAG: hypothetical protein IJZ46_05260 [Bacilli bacterium]|nr:hypothetical protein [Bacilli bacterium]
MARRKRYKKKDLMLFLGLSVASILLIIIYFAYSNVDPYNKVKIDKRLEIIYPVYEKDDYIVPAININDENINIINQEIVNKANTYLAKKGSSISYNYSISGEIISLAIQYVELDKFERPIVSFDTYNINVLKKHVLSDEEILSKLSVSEEEIYNIVSSKFREFYKDEVDKKVLDGECDYECFLYMRGIEDDNYTKDRKLYINSGNLYVLKAFDIYSPFSEENYFTFNDYLFQITE